MKKIAFATAGVLLAQSAFAYDPVNGTTELEFPMSGATATEKTILDYVLDDLCDQSFDIRLYTDEFDVGTPRNFDKRFAVACTLTDASTGVDLADDETQALLYKQGDGGSGTGVAPVCDESPTVDMLDPRVAGCPASAVTTAGNVDVYDCSGGSNDAQTPIFGLSDVGSNEVLELASSCASPATVKPAFVLPFGVPVSTKLRDALQLAQGIRPLASVDPTWATDDDDSDGVSNAEDAENVPSMSASMLTSLNSGTVANWSEITVRDPNNGGALTPLDSIVGLGAWGIDPNDAANYADGSPSNGVTLCHRVLSSGTRAQMEVVNNRRSCVGGAPVLTTPTTPGIFASPPFTMPLNSGSSNMSRCLTNMNNGDDYNVNQTSLPSRTFGSIWALGHQALGKVPAGATPGDKNEGSGRDGYRFIALNGVLPVFENIANGSYANYAESVITYGPNITAEQLKVADAIFNDTTSVAALAPLARDHSFGTVNLMAFGSPSVAGGEYDNSNPVTPLTRGGDNCQVATKNPSFTAIVEQ